MKDRVARLDFFIFFMLLLPSKKKRTDKRESYVLVIYIQVKSVTLAPLYYEDKPGKCASTTSQHPTTVSTMKHDRNETFPRNEKRTRTPAVSPPLEDFCIKKGRCLPSSPSLSSPLSFFLPFYTTMSSPLFASTRRLFEMTPEVSSSVLTLSK